MPLPFLAIAAIGALVGGGAVYVAEEKQKTKLKKCISDLERQQDELQRQIRQAADREVQHRKEKIQLLLKYYHARTGLMLQSETISTTRFARLSAISQQLIVVSNRLLTDGNPHPEDMLFIEVIQKAMNANTTGNPPTKLELAQLDQYLENQCPGAMMKVMEEMLSKQFSEKQLQIQKLASEKRENLMRQAQLEKLIDWNEGDSSHQVELQMLQGRMKILPQESATLEKSIQQLRMQLVVLTILSDPNLKTPHDHLVEGIIQRQLQGRMLTPEEEKILQTYQVTYFNKAKQALEQKKIYLAA